MDTIRIVLVEDDPVWRTMLTDFMNNESDLHVVKAVETKDEAIHYCKHNKHDIVLMDINLTHNNLDGIQAILELNLIGTEAKVIALTSLSDEKVIIETYTAGAIQYISKNDFRILPETIRRAMNSTSPQEILAREYMRLREAEQYNKLTAAEREIVTLSQEGATREQIKEKLNKSEGTLKNQITSILRKFGVRSMKEVDKKIKSRGLNAQEFEQ